MIGKCHLRGSQGYCLLFVCYEALLLSVTIMGPRATGPRMGFLERRLADARLKSKQVQVQVVGDHW